MVKEFDQAIFSPSSNIGEVIGPIKTQFGYYLIYIESRIDETKKDK